MTKESVQRSGVSSFQKLGSKSPCFLLTIDVEDWFQVENFKKWITFDSWSTRELRVEKNTYLILDLLDSIELKPASAAIPKHGGNSIKATFFILGWIAERLPGLVKEIKDRGHEVASHGFDHNLASGQDRRELKQDLITSKNILEDIIGVPVCGYRAPSFSIDDDSLKIIEDCGYLYDSSYNSFAMHGRYGQASFSDKKRQGMAIRMSDSFYELPISNLSIGNNVFPLGGGAYFRLFPLSFFKFGIKMIIEKKSAYLFYMHPWELDPQQPRVDEANMSFKFRHYANLKKCRSRLNKLLKAFLHCDFITCRQYLESSNLSS